LIFLDAQAGVSTPNPMIRSKQNTAPTVQRKLHLDSLAVGLLLVCSAFWGFQQVLVKATIVEIAPVFQAALRFGAATVLLVLWCRWRGLACCWGATSRCGPACWPAACLPFEFACLYMGLQYSAASRLTVFLYTAPFWVAVLCCHSGCHPSACGPLQWLGLALAFVAVLFALRDGLVQAANPKQWLGDVMALAAGLAWGLTTVTIRTTRLTLISPEKLLFYQIGVSAALVDASACRYCWVNTGTRAVQWLCRHLACCCKPWWAHLPATWPGCGCWGATRPPGFRCLLS
jgi:drug/metabolite transporter (DMT)-like permease